MLVNCLQEASLSENHEPFCHAMQEMRKDARELLLRLLRALQGRAAGHRLSERRFAESGGEGIWRFNWLPVHCPGVRSSRARWCTVPQALRAHLGLENSSSRSTATGPRRGALLETCTFKEFEAAVVLQNARENGVEGLIVASAGNTARAFAHLSTATGFPVVIVVPRMCLTEMWYLEAPGVPTVAVGDGDYSDSIDVAKRIAMVIGLPVRRRGEERREARRPRPGAARGGLGHRAGCRTTTSRRWAAAPALSASGRWPSGSSPTGGSGRACRCCTWGRTCPSRRWRKAWERGERRLEPQDLGRS